LWTADHPFHAKVASAKWLTNTSLNEDNYYSWSEEKQVIQLDLHLEDSGITYVPGDSIGICCPNPDYTVNIVLEVLRKAHSKPLSSESNISCINFPSLGCLGDLLRYGIDLVGCPKKASIATLAQYCKDPEESVLMQNLCSKSTTGKELWSNFIETQNIGLGELLCLVPSCCPTLSALLQCASSLPPRYYSIASSPLRDPTKVSVAFSIVRYSNKIASKSNTGEVPPEIQRKGVCTHYLQTVLKPWLCQRSDQTLPPTTYIRMFHKASINFQLPGSVGPPLILVGPGTGVAPFIGFLDHRALLEYERKNNGGEDMSTGLWRGGFELDTHDLPCECNFVEEYIHSVTPGPIHLFFGCRNDNDYLYKSTFVKHLNSGTLTSLEVAKSRVSDQKVYVTHKLLERGAELARLLLNDGAYFYVCGDGNQMAKDVYNALKQVLMKHSCHTTEESAEQVLVDLKHRRRYVLDIWS